VSRSATPVSMLAASMSTLTAERARPLEDVEREYILAAVSPVAPR
jgi:hypothetical protein